MRQIQQFINQGDFTFSIERKDAYLNISVVKCHHDLLYFVWQIYLTSRKFGCLDWPQLQGFHFTCVTHIVPLPM